MLWPHGGDIAFDKRFYLEAGGRSNEPTFAALYSLAPLNAWRLSMFNFNPSLLHHLIQS